jgi:hypothetical protein
MAPFMNLAAVMAKRVRVKGLKYQVFQAHLVGILNEN